MHHTTKKRNSTNNNTLYIMSMDDEYACAMLATLESPVQTHLRTLITIRGTNHSQIIHIQINSHTRSVLGRTHHQLYLTPGT